MSQLIIIIVTLLYTTVSCRDENPVEDKWLGHYTITQTCDGATNPRYTMRVSAVDSSRVYLHNLGGYGKKVEATVQHDSLIITPTDVGVGLMGNVRLSGSGSFQNQSLTVQLNVRVPGPQGTTTTSRCELRGTKVKD